MVKGRGVRGIKMDHDKRTFFRYFTYLCIFHISVFFVIFLVHNVHTIGTWQFFCIENWNTVQLFNILYFLFKGEFGIWIIYLHAEFRMQIHTEFRGIPRNSGQFYCKKYRGISRNSVCFSKNSVFRRKSKTHFRGHPTYSIKKHGEKIERF